MNKASEVELIKEINTKPGGCCWGPKPQQGAMSGLVSGKVHTLAFSSIFFFLRNKQNIFLVVRSKILLMILPRVCLPPALTGNGAFTLTYLSYFQEILEYVNSPDQM